MAIRVRKLARELRGSSGEVLGLLHELGLERYRSPEDMLSDGVVDRVRRAWKKGIRGSPVRVGAPAAPPPAPPRTPKPPDGNDLMSQLVPGVVPRGQRGRKKARPAPPVDAPIEQVAAPNAEIAEVEALRRELTAAIERDREAIAAERAALQAERAELEGERAALAERVAALEAERAALLGDREVLTRDRADLDARAVPAITDVLAERGLRGADEFERALVGLATLRRLRDLLPVLEVADRGAALRVLGEGLLLVGGEVPEGLPGGIVGVRVAPERGELPGWADLRRELGRAAEMLMLHGLRHVAVVGAPPRWQRLLREAFDPRIELRFAAGQPSDDEEDRLDVVLYWSGTGPETDLGARPLVVNASADGLVEFARAVRDALAED